MIDAEGPRQRKEPDAPLEALAERALPYSRDAEEAVLGAMILDSECVGDVVEVLRADDFYVKHHRTLFEALLELFQSGSGTDLTILGEVLLKKGAMESVGGPLALTRLVDRVPSSANVTYHARIVLEKSLLRRLIGAANEILHESRSGSHAVEHLVDQAESKVFEVAHRSAAGGQSQTFKDTLKEILHALENTRQGEFEGTHTHYPDLDNMLGGMRGGQMLILAARPSMGKTTLAINIALRVATREPRRAAVVFSLEMSQQQIAQNMLCSFAQIEAHHLRRGTIGGDDAARLGEKVDELAEAPIFIDDTPGLTMLQIRAKARRLQAAHDLGVIIVDYLQLVSTGTRVESRQLEISQISMSLKQLSRELDVPVIALSQLNRSVESRENHRPRMSDLRESGSLEQDADVVMFIHRDEYFDPNRTKGAGDGRAQIIIAKQRNGPVGEVELTFFPSQLRFEPYSELDYVG